MILSLFLSIIIPLIFGFCILNLFFYATPYFIKRSPDNEKHNILEFFIWSYGTGCGLITLFIFVLSILGLPFNLWVFNLPLLILFLINIIFIFLKRRIAVQLYFSSFRRFSFIEIALILIILFEIFFALSESVLRPVINFDAIAQWGWNAKVLFFEGHQFFDSHSDLFLGGVHINYPLHIPLLMTWFYFWQKPIGDIAFLRQIDTNLINDASVNLLFSLYFLALVGLIYFSLRRIVSRKLSLLFAAILATLPLIDYHSFNAYADLPLAFYFTGAAVFMFFYFQNQRKQWLILSAIFSGLAAWTKNEGLFLAIIIFVILFLYLLKEKKIRTHLKDLAIFFIIFSVIFWPWMLYKLFYGLGYSNMANDSFGSLGFHPEIFSPVLFQIFFARSFNLWFGIFVLILFIRLKQLKKDHNLYLLLIILGSVLSYFLIYLLTPSFKFAMDGTVVGRNFITIAPFSIFLAANLLSARGGKSE